MIKNIIYLVSVMMMLILTSCGSGKHENNMQSLKITDISNLQKIQNGLVGKWWKIGDNYGTSFTRKYTFTNNGTSVHIINDFQGKISRKTGTVTHVETKNYAVPEHHFLINYPDDSYERLCIRANDYEIIVSTLGKELWDGHD